MPEMITAGVYGVRKDQGGTCERCNRNRTVVYVSWEDLFACGDCLRGDQDVRDRTLVRDVTAEVNARRK